MAITVIGQLLTRIMGNMHALWLRLFENSTLILMLKYILRVDIPIKSAAT